MIKSIMQTPNTAIETRPLFLQLSPRPYLCVWTMSTEAKPSVQAFGRKAVSYTQLTLPTMEAV